jgi:AraC family transcriptional regulator, regulatory protein of adaptative response / methylated-DNA-[protein]-cysteine methyltransferase
MSVRDAGRIEKAILYLEARAQDQPSLEEVARHVGLSEHHFQRLFRRWCGISPKRFLQFLTLAEAKRLLDESRSVLDAALETGLSGPGRLHDLFVGLEAVTPGEYKAQGFGLTVTCGFHESPFGPYLLAVTHRGICGLSFLRDRTRVAAIEEVRGYWPGAQIVLDDRATKPMARRVFSPPAAVDPPLPLFVRGTNFQIKVWEALLGIPEGCVLAYEDVARMIGNPRAVRAVGQAVGHNPVAYLIPCHRVIRATGAFGNYGGGPARKRAMLVWEAARKERAGAPA